MTHNSHGQARGIERLYLDFDSFFASAEQHFNPDLRGRPVGVVPLDSLHTGCIAVSRQAKALGVKSGATILKAREIVPEMIFVVARHDVYVRLHKRILNVIDTVVPVAHVRSIDEVVCNLLPSESDDATSLARRLKAALPNGTTRMGLGSSGRRICHKLSPISTSTICPASRKACVRA